MSTLILAQGKGLYIVDSLTQSSDLSDIWRIPESYEAGNWVITGIDSGATYADSINVYAGSIRTAKYSTTPVDTVWAKIVLITGANNNTIWVPAMAMPQLIKLEFANVQSVAFRKWNYIIEGQR